ncbi:MAG TPA: adenylate/guanylate cyclase domain-containing protein [Nocardioidaceae bacterium]|nr:adenylate/guanylate cyclase domain-containing protein [Nocardioidaceae bacterium]
MQCSQCGAASPAGNKFCGECGKALALQCPSCGTANPAGVKFCGECGTSLAAPSIHQQPVLSAPGVRPAEEGPAASAGPVSERRVCSVLFCDLVGFTPWSEARDPEEVRELLSRYFDVARTVIGRHGGVVEKFIGDAVMAVWGTPSANEGDAERAVRAALELLDAVAQLGRESGATGLSARAGVVTGPVAVTVGAMGEGMVAGDAVNTAARIQGAADPGAVLVDDPTRQMTEAAISFTTAGEHALKGKAEPVPLWRAMRVVGGTAGSQRIDGLEAGFVGRDSELRLVKELFHACEQRRSPRLVSVTGAAGVGKSRLGWEFRKYIDGLLVTVWWHQGRCLSYGDGVAFWALGEMVRQRLQIAEDDSASAASEKLVAGLERLLDDPAERAYVGPRLGQLLGVQYGEATAMLGREELFAGWRLLFERLAATGPVVILVEDLQHADVGLLDFLEHLLDWARDVPIFVLTLARPELEDRRGGWGTGRRNSTALSLDPLDDTAMDGLLEDLVPGMPSIGKTAIGTRAEGIPLYAVETVRMLIDRDVVQPVDGVYRLVGDVGELAVPATLQSLLAARLDALEPEERRLVADAAVLGGTFPAEALVAVSDQAEAQVRQLLVQLVRREVLGVRADPLSPQRGHYAFMQTMFRQVAYDTLSRRERKARHLAVARHLRTTFADQGEEITEVIATHLLDALHAVPDDPDVPDLRADAITMLTRAGERAERTGAPAVATAIYTTASDLLDATHARDTDLAAAALRERAGGTANIGGDFVTAIDRYESAAASYRRHGQARSAARAETLAGAVLRRQGRLEEARTKITAALEVLQDEPDADTVNALAALANVDAFAGNATEAIEESDAALAQAQALGLPDEILAVLFTIGGLSQQVASRPAQATASFREAVLRAEAAGKSSEAATAYLNLGDSLVTTDPGAAVEASRAAISLSRRIGHRYAMGVAQANLIQALLLTGDWIEADQVYTRGVTEDGHADDPALAFSAAILFALRGDEARLSAAMAIVDNFAGSEDTQDIAEHATAMAAAAALDGSHERALSHARVSLAQAGAVNLRHDAIRWVWPIAADAALALEDDAEVLRLLDWLDDHPPGHIPPVLRAERLRVRARLHERRGEAEAGPAFATATKAFRDLGSPFHLSTALLDHAQHVSSHGDLETAAELAAEAGVIAERLLVTPLMQRVEQLGGLGGAQPAHPVHVKDANASSAMDPQAISAG